MGKGDKKSARGKRWRGSYGVTRRRKKDTVAVAAAPKAEKKAKPAAKKSTAKKTSKKAE